LCANRRPVTPRKLAGIKAWRVAHPERVRRYQRTYDDRVRTEPTLLDRHRARDRASAARQKALDPDGYTCQKAWKHARRRYGPRDYTFEQWVAVWSGSCFGCGLTPARGVDHIVGERSGGANALSNLQPACLHCNHSKARKVAA
jgi:5-methylcytosine-specific restriction endonuclease McrA